MVTASEGTNFPLFLHRNSVTQTSNNFRGHSATRNILQDLDSFPEDSDSQRKLHKIVKKQMAVSDYKKKNKRSVLTVFQSPERGTGDKLEDGAIKAFFPNVAPSPNLVQTLVPIQDQDLLDKMANNLLQRLYEQVKNRLIEEHIDSRGFGPRKEEYQELGFGVGGKEKEGLSGETNSGGETLSGDMGRSSVVAKELQDAPLNIVPLVRLKIEPTNDVSKELVNRIKIVPVGPHSKASVVGSGNAPTVQLNIEPAGTMNDPIRRINNGAKNTFASEAENDNGVTSVFNLEITPTNQKEAKNFISSKNSNNGPILNLQIPTGEIGGSNNFNEPLGKPLNSPFSRVNRVPTIHINATVANAPHSRGSKHFSSPFSGINRSALSRFGSSRKHGSQSSAISSTPMLNLQIATGNNPKGSKSRFSFGAPIIPPSSDIVTPLDIPGSSDNLAGSDTMEKPPADTLTSAALGIRDNIAGIPNIILAPEGGLPIFGLNVDSSGIDNTLSSEANTDLKTALENAHRNALASAYTHAVAKAMGIPQEGEFESFQTRLKPEEAGNGGNVDDLTKGKSAQESADMEKPYDFKKTLEEILSRTGTGFLKFTQEDPPNQKEGTGSLKGTDEAAPHKKAVAFVNIIQDNPENEIPGRDLKAAIGNMFGKNGLAVVKITQEPDNRPIIDFKNVIDNILKEPERSRFEEIRNRVPIRGVEIGSVQSVSHANEDGREVNMHRDSPADDFLEFARLKCGSGSSGTTTTTPATKLHNITRIKSVTAPPPGSARVTNVISITFANFSGPKESTKNSTPCKAFKVAPMKAFKIAPVEAFKISPIKALRLAPPQYAMSPGPMTDFDLAINNAINNALVNVLSSETSNNEQQNNEERKGLPAPVNFLYQPLNHNHVDGSGSGDGTKCSEGPQSEDEMNVGLSDSAKDTAKPEGEITELILKRLKDFVSSAQKFIPEKDFLFKRRVGKSEKGKDNETYLHQKSSVIIPDQNDLHCYYECEAMPFGCMKLKHKQCPRGQFFSMKYKKCLKMSYWKARRRKKSVPGFPKKIEYPEGTDDSEPSNEWLDATQGANQKIPPEFKPKQKPTLKIYHLRVKRNGQYESKGAEKREAVLNRGKNQGKLGKKTFKGVSKRQGFHKHHPRSFLIRINKKEGKHSRDRIIESDEDESEDDNEEGDEEEDDDEDPDESEEETDDEITEDEGEKTTEKLSRTESIKEFFKSAKAAVANRAKFIDPTLIAASENANKENSGVKNVKKTGEAAGKSGLTGGKSGTSASKSGSELTGKPKQVLLDASIKVDSALSSALRSILKSKQKEKGNLEVGYEGLISDRGSQDQLDPELLRVYQHLIRNDPRVKRNYKGNFAEKGH